MKLLILAIILSLVPLEAQTLQMAGSARGVKVGTAVNASDLANSSFQSALIAQYSQVEPENEMKWSSIHPSQNQYSFTNADSIVSFATTNRMSVRGHVLVGDVSYPSWLHTAGNTSARLSTLVQAHISTVVGRYAGRVYAWDVVNEAFDAGGNLKTSLWYNQPGLGGSGTAYIESAFRWAHTADPSAKLFYNDVNAEELNPQSNAIYAMAKDFITRGVPIHGIGLEMHLTAAGLTSASLEANIKRFTDLGLQVQITELDVRLPVDASGNATSNALAVQGAVYNSVVTSCLKFPLCTAVQTWGVSDEYSWIPTFFPGFGSALPMDTNYAPKPAYYGLRSGLDPNYPVVWPTGVLNAASYLTGPVAPGELVMIFPSSTGPAAVGSTPVNGQFPTSFQGIQVTFDGIPAAVISVAPTYSIVLVPFEIAGRTQTVMQYELGTAVSNSVTLQVAAAAPALFTANGSGTGEALAVNKYALVSSTNPASSLDTVTFYATGTGTLAPAFSSVGVVPSSPPAAALPITIMVNGSPAQTLSATASPGGNAGVLQIEVKLPAIAAGTTLHVTLSAGTTVSSQTTALN